jgi:site-specific recombinase XerD
MKILFWIYKSRVNAAGKAPIMIRFTHEGKRLSFSTNLFIACSQWDSIRQRVKGSIGEAKEFNAILQSFKNKAWQEYAEILRKGGQPNLTTIKDIISGKNKPVITLTEAIKIHIQQLRSRLGIDVSHNTIKKYETLLRKIKSFLESELGRDINLYELTRNFIEDLDTYMRKDQQLSHNGVAKNMQQLKRIIRVAVQQQWLDKDPFSGYSCVIKPSDRACLNSKELSMLELFRFENERLRRVRDIFIFCCYTGLAYADVSKVSIYNLEKDEEGITWLKVNRTKTGNSSLVPLLPIAYRLIQSYNSIKTNTATLLPVISNQNLNKYLKEIAQMVGIMKRLTMHLARHTFATTVTLEKGIDITSVSRMLGHKDIRTTQIYSKITKLKIANDMRKLLFNVNEQ